MIRVKDVEYISDKEAERLYGFSRDWFRKKRSLKNGGPPYIKIAGKVLYQTKQLEDWFKNNIKPSDES